jgi:hypothetical protein
MIKLFHLANATLFTGRRKRNGLFKMGSCNLKRFRLVVRKENSFHRMELGCLLIKRGKSKTVRFID